MRKKQKINKKKQSQRAYKGFVSIVEWHKNKFDIMPYISNIYENNYSMIMVVFVLLQNIWKYYKKIEYVYNKFILERYLYNIRYKSVKIIDNKNKMYKNKTHLFKVNNNIIEEKRFLSDFFNKKL